MKSRTAPILTLLVMIVGAIVTGSAQTEGGQPGARTLPPDSIAADSVALDSVASDSIGDNARPVPRAPRRATPVDIDEQKREPVLHYYDKHGELLEEPVLFLATLDTVTKPKSKPVYPSYNGVSVGVNFGDAIMMAFGQKYGSYDVWADVSLWNWLFPVVEAGVGFCDATPDNKNFTYKVKPSLYVKAGVNYNFLYKSNPDYQLFLGLRAGMSSFGWDATDINISSDYWQEDQRFDMKGMRSTSFYGEALAGIKVKIVSNFSLGWSVRYRFPFHTSTSTPKGLPAGLTGSVPSNPWFIPGYGSKVGFTVSAIWTIPAKKKATPAGQSDQRDQRDQRNQSNQSNQSDQSNQSNPDGLSSPSSD